NGFLLEITADIFSQVDDETGQRLIDVILDEAGQKGTGMWASQDAMALQVPTPTIDVAVAMRDLSALKEERSLASRQLPGPTPRFDGDRAKFLAQLPRALLAGMALTFAEWMAQLRRASEAYAYHLDLEAVARIW